MTPKYYHTPLKPVSTRARCPVCNQTVYSRAGIHPQCAVVQCDPPKLRGKPKVALALVAQAAKGADQAVAMVVAEPPIAQPVPVSDGTALMELIRG